MIRKSRAKREKRFVSPEKNERLVLVGVIRREKDLRIARTQRWYRIPLEHAPKRRPDYVAFYQTSDFGRSGKRIQYYAAVKDVSIATRRNLLPDEGNHPRASGRYLKMELGPIKKLPRPIVNRTRRRVTFGFATLDRLKKAREMSLLFGIPPVEDMMKKALKRHGIRSQEEYCVSDGKRTRYRLDFAILCRRGKIAIECDNEKSHGQKRQVARDRVRDRWLKKHGWTVIRFPGREVCSDMGECILRMKSKIREFGGLGPQET